MSREWRETPVQSADETRSVISGERNKMMTGQSDVSEVMSEMTRKWTKQIFADVREASYVIEAMVATLMSRGGGEIPDTVMRWYSSGHCYVRGCMPADTAM